MVRGGRQSTVRGALYESTSIAAVYGTICSLVWGTMGAALNLGTRVHGNRGGNTQSKTTLERGAERDQDLEDHGLMTPRFHNRSLSATNCFERLCTASRKLRPSHLALGEPTAHPDLLSNSIDLAESSSRAVLEMVHKF